MGREEEARKQREIEEMKQHPSLKAVFEHFPDARITDVRMLGPEDNNEE